MTISNSQTTRLASAERTSSPISPQRIGLFAALVATIAAVWWVPDPNRPSKRPASPKEIARPTGSLGAPKSALTASSTQGNGAAERSLERWTSTTNGARFPADGAASGAASTLFGPQSWAPPPPPAPPPAPPAPPPKPEPPAFRFAYVGKTVRAGEPAKLILSVGVDLQFVREGDQLDGYKVVRIGADSVTLSHPYAQGLLEKRYAEMTGIGALAQVTPTPITPTNQNRANGIAAPVPGAAPVTVVSPSNAAIASAGNAGGNVGSALPSSGRGLSAADLSDPAIQRALNPQSNPSVLDRNAPVLNPRNEGGAAPVPTAPKTPMILLPPPPNPLGTPTITPTLVPTVGK